MGPRSSGRPSLPMGRNSPGGGSIAGMSESVPVVDVFEMTASGPEANWVYFADRVHPNLGGHSRIAERMRQALTRLGLPATAPE